MGRGEFCQSPSMRETQKLFVAELKCRRLFKALNPVSLAPTRMSIAVIGPDKKRRAVVAKALANSEDRSVQEFAAYPEDLSDLPRMVGQNFDVVMIDLDSDEDYALAIVANLATISNAMVMVYSTRNDPALLMNSKRAGARDFLPIPAEVGRGDSAACSASCGRAQARPRSIGCAAGIG